MAAKASTQRTVPDEVLEGILAEAQALLVAAKAKYKEAHDFARDEADLRNPENFWPMVYLGIIEENIDRSLWANIEIRTSFFKFKSKK